MTRPSSYRVLKSCGNCAHFGTHITTTDKETIHFCTEDKVPFPDRVGGILLPVEVEKWDHAEKRKIEANGLCNEHKMRMIGK